MRGLPLRRGGRCAHRSAAGYFKSKWCVMELFDALCSSDITVIPIYLETAVVEMAGTDDWLGDIFGTTVAQRDEARDHEALFDRKVCRWSPKPPLRWDRSPSAAAARPRVRAQAQRRAVHRQEQGRRGEEHADAEGPHRGRVQGPGQTARPGASPPPGQSRIAHYSDEAPHSYRCPASVFAARLTVRA